MGTISANAVVNSASKTDKSVLSLFRLQPDIKNFKKVGPISVNSASHNDYHSDWHHKCTTRQFTGPYIFSCKQKNFQEFGICPIIL